LHHSKISRRRPRWVKNGPDALEMECLYCPRKQTSLSAPHAPLRLAGPFVGASVATAEATNSGHSMDANEAPEAIRTLVRVALSMADEGLSLETLAEQYP
jgi:hypothetical protein